MGSFLRISCLRLPGRRAMIFFFGGGEWGLLGIGDWLLGTAPESFVGAALPRSSSLATFDDARLPAGANDLLVEAAELAAVRKSSIASTNGWPTYSTS